MSKEKLESLFKQIKAGEATEVKEILTHDLYLINEVDIDGWGPIHICASNGQNVILKMLVEEFQANVNQRTEYANTPIHVAAKCSKINTILELKKLGADLTLENRGHENVLDCLQRHHIKIPDYLFHQIFDDVTDLMEGANFSIHVSGDIVEVC